MCSNGGMIKIHHFTKMLPQVASKAWYHGFDAFTGALMTLMAIGTCLALFACETSAFWTDSPTRWVVDINEDELLKIHFDISMIDIDCDHLTVGVWDAFGTERFNIITRDIRKQRVDHTGKNKGSSPDFNSFQLTCTLYMLPMHILDFYHFGVCCDPFDAKHR